MDFPKSVPGIGLVDGRFVDEDPAIGRIGSLIPAAWGNTLTEEVLNVLRAAGIEPDEASASQLLEAIRIVASRGTTRLPGDDSEYWATTAWVNRRGVQFSSLATYDLSTRLSADATGQFAILTIPGGGTVTLPPASEFSAGAFIGFRSNVPNQVVAAAGDDTFNGSGGGLPVTSVTLNDGDNVYLVSNGAAQWLMIGGNAQLRYTQSFSHAIASNGYQKLPSGLIIQWGLNAAGTTSAGAAVTFPLAFPNACFQVIASDSGNQDYAYGCGTPSKNGFVLTGGVAGGASYTNGAARWVAIGN